MPYDKRLTTLSILSGLLAQSPKLEDILPTAIDMVADVMRIEVVLIYTLEASSNELVLLAYRGVPPEFARGADRVELGEGFNGRAAEIGQPMLVTDSSQDPRLSREVVRQEKLKAQLIVPMKSKGRVVGTICVATRSSRQFPPEEIELLTAISNEIGIAIENARLYQEQLDITERLRRSEANYRDLFENASDAIWIHDLEGNIVEANKACEKITGYAVGALPGRNVSEFLAGDALALARQVKSQVLSGETVERYQQRLVRTDGTEAIVDLSTRLITSNEGQPIGFQNIARDVTEERRTTDNLRFYLEHVLRAIEQERRRISRELHDDVAQSMMLLVHQLDDLVSDPHNRLGKTNRKALEQIRDLGTKIGATLRDYARSLRPDILDHLGLNPALQSMAESLSREQGIKASVEVSGTEWGLSPEAKLVLFRIAQEALSNVKKHAAATSVLVRLRYDADKVTMTVVDDGKGFEPPPRLGDLVSTGKLGLTGMEERARLVGGTVHVRSEVGVGTTVTAELPLSNE